ncbi:hypothetical protein ZIOFF_061379 [Zingiber officinale]|uniref:FAD-binding FR-type domain-containing protein n=2 Tax=Zingiber officinale TaxID=94328 RepID=A0A8J5F4B5_ZINOF|nr:hypothetical protein ZIOFF_061379 [Zingiber officinale]
MLRDLLLLPPPPFLRPMSLLPRLRIGVPFTFGPSRRALTVLATAAWQGAATWTPAPISLVAPADADATLFHVAVDVSDSPDLAFSFTSPGQYLQLRVPDAKKPVFLAIASPPYFAVSRGEFQFLVKRFPGSTADLLCGLERGDVVELSEVMGRGFPIERISSPDAFPTVLIFATGSGISEDNVDWRQTTATEVELVLSVSFTRVMSMNNEIEAPSPIRSLIESCFNTNERSDVRLYYGIRNLQRMAYQDRFKDWESSGVKIIPVLSQPDERWSGERGYVQAAFSRDKRILNPLSTGAVLCGHRQMAEDVTSELVASGMLPPSPSTSPASSKSDVLVAAMGNAACAHYSASAKVINGAGEIEEYVGRRPVRAGEVMVEHPGQFVCDAGRLGVGYRVPGLAADEELERRRLYFLLPMDMLFSVLTEEEMEALASRAAAAKSYFGRRIFPALSDFSLVRDEVKHVRNEPATRKRTARQRSWTPALETIEEVP